MIRPEHSRAVRIVLAAVAAATFTVAPPPRARADKPRPADPSAAIKAYGEEISGLVAATYARRGETTLWFGAPARVTDRAVAVLSAMKKASLQGLDPRDYGLDELERTMNRLSSNADVAQDELSRADAMMTTAVVRYVHDLAEGRLDPRLLGILGGEAPPPRIDVAGFVDSLTRDGDVDAALATVGPRHPEYVRLRSALARYETFSTAGPWPVVPAGPLMKPGEEHEPRRLAALARRLRAENLVGEAVVAKKTDAYDGALVTGVRRFQSLRGLAVDGVIGPRTLAELNRPVAGLIRTIQLNMERWRWVPDDLGAAHVRVNVPAFMLGAYEDGEEKFRMPIIVGQATWGTPLFSDRIRSVILNPYWNVPQSIARKEVLAKVFADRAYLSRESMEIVSGSGAASHVVSPHDVNWAAYTPATFPYRLRQKPGPLNPLGRIKFSFPNRYNVFLHDTPSGRLFSLPDRALSHGCIRIAHPLDLAAWLFRDDPKWSGTRIADAIQAGSQEAIVVPHPVPLHIFYFTAVASTGEKLELYQDLYGIDASLDRSLGELTRADRTLLLQGAREASFRISINPSSRGRRA